MRSGGSSAKVLAAFVAASTIAWVPGTTLATNGPLRGAATTRISVYAS